jgi:hypothetical protein
MTPTFLIPPAHFTRDEFRAYVDGLKFVGWAPRMPYLHNTGVPSLRQWLAMGATPQERWGGNLNRYYEGMGWHAGPHAVACPDYIWTLCDFTKPGVAQSCSNSAAWAIEMVGNYEVGGDDFATGDGAKVRDNAAFAIAVVAEAVKWPDLADYNFNERGLHFHRDCKADHHACPGSKVARADMLARIAAFRAEIAGKPVVRAPPAPRAATNKADRLGNAPAAVVIVSAEDVQAALNRLGYGPIKVDGSYGPRTQEAVKAFQGKNGCSVDGWVGDETRTAIIESLVSAVR